MNKLYKVIWNDARQMYIVASELAKSHGKSKSSRSKAAALTFAVTLALTGMTAGTVNAEENYSVDSERNIVIDKNHNEDGKGAGGINSMAAGFNTATNGIASAVTGAYSYIGDLDHLGTHQGTSSSILFQGATSSVYGSFNLIKTDPLGQETDGVASSIFGQANKTENANAAIIMGAGNQITNSYRDVDFSKINQS